MNSSDDNTAAEALRGWWLSPSRPSMHRLISPWDTATSVSLGSRALQAAAWPPPRRSEPEPGQALFSSRPIIRREPLAPQPRGTTQWSR